MNYTIAHADRGDAEGLVSLVKELHAEGLPTLLKYTSVPSLEDELAFIEGHSESGNSALWVTKDATAKIVGVMNLDGYPHPQRMHTAGFGMSLLAGHRGKGLGTRMINAMLDWAGKAGLERVELEVLSNNTGAAKLYRKMGFVEEGRKVGAVRLDDEVIDIILMAKYHE